MNKAEELKACPFCGRIPKTSHRPESEASGGGHVAFVVCYCGGYASTAHQMGHAETVQAAIAEVVEKWNTRAQLPSQGGEDVSRDWTEDAKHENGEYMNTCCECKNTFTGHKRRFICKACSTSQGGEAVALTVWCGPMPESNGKSNFTAILMRKGADMFDGIAGGITIARSEYPDRVRYEADRMRYLIGELDAEPDILAYDPDKHSGYTHPADQVAEPDAELVELLRNKFPRIDPCKPVPLDEKAHCCEYTIYVERERLHRMIDAKMASLGMES